MFKKISIKTNDLWRKTEYILYENNKICIAKQYNDSGKQNYLKDLEQCLWMPIYGIISIIGFPFCLLYTLYNFIPKIYIKDRMENTRKENQHSDAKGKTEKLLIDKSK